MAITRRHKFLIIAVLLALAISVDLLTKRDPGPEPQSKPGPGPTRPTPTPATEQPSPDRALAIEVPERMTMQRAQSAEPEPSPLAPGEFWRRLRLPPGLAFDVPGGEFTIPPHRIGILFHGEPDTALKIVPYGCDNLFHAPCSIVWPQPDGKYTILYLFDCLKTGPNGHAQLDPDCSVRW